MRQKTKLFILAVLAIIIIAGGIYLMQSNKPAEQIIQPKDSAQTEPANQTIPGETPRIEQKATEPVNEDTAADAIREISGKIRSINEKAVYIELSDGKGFAVNINPKTPVFTQGITNPGTLVSLKAGQNVTVKVDSASNAVEILIRK